MPPVCRKMPVRSGTMTPSRAASMQPGAPRAGRYSLRPGSASESVIRLRAKLPTIGNVGSGDGGKAG